MPYNIATEHKSCRALYTFGTIYNTWDFWDCKVLSFVFKNNKCVCIYPLMLRIISSCWYKVWSLRAKVSNSCPFIFFCNCFQEMQHFPQTWCYWNGYEIFCCFYCCWRNMNKFLIYTCYTWKCNCECINMLM